MTHDGLNAAGDQEWLDAHVHQTRDSAWRVVGVKRAEHQVSSERGLNGDVRNFAITNFTDQNNVGRLAQHGFQNGRKCETNLFTHLDLIDALEVVLNGILGGDDFFVGTIQHRERGIQRGGFTATSRTRDQENAVGFANDLVERVQHVLFKTQVQQTNAHAIWTQNTKHHAFAVCRGTRADTKVDLVHNRRH